MTMVTEQGYSYAEAARKPDLRDNLIRRRKAEMSAEGEQAFRGQGVPLLEDEFKPFRIGSSASTRRSQLDSGFIDLGSLRINKLQRLLAPGRLAASDYRAMRTLQPLSRDNRV